MNTQETTQILARLTATLRVNPPMTAELFSVWQDHLRDVKFIDAAEAVDQTINAATFLPPISDFRAQCKRNAHHRRLQETRQEVVHALEEPMADVEVAKARIEEMRQSVEEGRERARQRVRSGKAGGSPVTGAGREAVAQK